MEKMYEVYTNGLIPANFHAEIVQSLNNLNAKNKVRATISPMSGSFTINCSMNTEDKMDKHAKQVYELCKKRLKKNTDITRFELAF